MDEESAIVLAMGKGRGPGAAAQHFAPAFPGAAGRVRAGFAALFEKPAPAFR